MNESKPPAVIKRILEARRVIADPNSSSFDVFAARQELKMYGVEEAVGERDSVVEIQRLRSAIAARDPNPIEVHAAIERLKQLGAAAAPVQQSDTPASTPTWRPTPEQVARYDRARASTFLVIGSLVALLLYWFFKSDRTVDYYLNNYQERLEKIQECGQLPDMTKDRECMNAITAQRLFMRR